MKFLNTFGALTALSLVVLYNAINAPLSHAAQLGLGDSLDKGTTLRTDTALSDVCEEEAPVVSPEALQPSDPVSQLGPNLVASAAVTDSSVASSSQVLVAQGFEDCGIGGVAPEGGLPAAAGFPLAAALIPAGAAAAVLPLALTGGDDPAPAPPAAIPPNVPEPAETATASLFACLGIAGVIARRKMNRSE